MIMICMSHFCMSRLLDEDSLDTLFAYSSRHFSALKLTGVNTLVTFARSESIDGFRFRKKYQMSATFYDQTIPRLYVY